MGLKCLGIMLVYNDGDCVQNALRCMVDAGHEVHAFDHGSTDETADIIKSMNGVTYHRIDRRKKTFNYCWTGISRFIGAMALEFDWVTWIAADEFLRDPLGQPLSIEAIELERSAGIRVIRPVVREFWLTEADGDDPDPMRRMRHYRMRPNMGPCPRSWELRLTRIMPFGLHRPNAGWGVSVAAISDRRWTVDHYPIRSMGQARRKIMRERNPRPYYGRHRKNNCRDIVRLAAQQEVI